MRPEEREAITTTIVGGRPPGCGRDVGAVPRGLEVLVKKAAVDAEFRALLLERRGEAAAQIGLALNPAEAAMLAAIPAAQLETIIDRTEVPEESRRAFLGTVAGAMLAALGLGLTGCGEQEPYNNRIEHPRPATRGIRPEFERHPPSKGHEADRPVRPIDLNTTEGQANPKGTGLELNVKIPTSPEMNDSTSTQQGKGEVMKNSSGSTNTGSVVTHGMRADKVIFK